MSVEYIWKIVQLERQSDTGAVTTAHWGCVGVDAEINLSHRIYGSVGFSVNSSSSNFIPFEDLSEPQVLKWVWHNIDRPQIEKTIADAIEQMKNPPVLSGLPW